ncbi:hypothetical protein HN873_016727, partial [Arachis hypogaea]
MAAASAIPTHMKAWAYSDNGKSNVALKFHPSIPVPELKADQILIKVVAAAINPIDYYKIAGSYNDSDAPFLVRSDFSPPPNVFNFVSLSDGGKSNEPDVGDRGGVGVVGGEEGLTVREKSLWLLEV